MKSLYEVLNDKGLIQDVVEIIQKSGFTDDIQIYCGDKITDEENIITLKLIVSQKTGIQIPWNRTLLLADKLSEKFQCKVTVDRIQEYSELAADGILRKSASITDEKRICELFEVRSTKAIFLNDSEKPDLDNVRRANEYLAQVGYKEKMEVAENLSKYAVVCEAEIDAKKRKVDSSGESDSPNQGNTESPQKSNNFGSTKK